MVDRLIDGPADARWTIALAHGAGAGMDTEFMAAFAEGLAARGLRVVRFEFPYMAARRRGGRRGPPDREPVLRQSWLEVIGELGREGLVIGGKSMGGRMATMVADEVRARGVVCFGYPFHPPGKPQQLRTAHLEHLQTPALFIQGTRDTFGNSDEVGTYELSSKIRVEWIEGGDHSLFKSKTKDSDRFLRTIDLAASFIAAQ